jgi:endo-1,4-beta-xylanase
MEVPVRYAVFRVLLVGLLGFVLVPVGAATADEPSLRSLADTRSRLIGSAVDTTVLATSPGYSDVLANQFSSVTPENVMKWQLVEPVRGVFDYAAADRLVAFAGAHNQLVRGHTLVWHNQLPHWISEDAFNSDELAAILEQHVTQEAEHFRGHIYAWDVVNEPFNDDGTWRDSIWYRALGPDYVAQALQWARAADPAAKLYINDYNTEASGPKSDALYALVQDLQAQQVPIDGVGFQAHLSTQNAFPPDLSANLQRFADLGIDVAITEADVRVLLPVTDAKLNDQANYFRQLLRSCLSVDRCVSFTVWGFTDAHSWVPSVFAGQGAATPYAEDLQPKPAYIALRDSLVQAQ